MTFERDDQTQHQEGDQQHGTLALGSPTARAKASEESNYNNYMHNCIHTCIMCRSTNAHTCIATPIKLLVHNTHTHTHTHKQTPTLLPYLVFKMSFTELLRSLLHLGSGTVGVMPIGKEQNDDKQNEYHIVEEGTNLV